MPPGATRTRASADGVPGNTATASNSSDKCKFTELEYSLMHRVSMNNIMSCILDRSKYRLTKVLPILYTVNDEKVTYVLEHTVSLPTLITNTTPKINVGSGLVAEATTPYENTACLSHEPDSGAVCSGININDLDKSINNNICCVCKQDEMTTALKNVLQVKTTNAESLLSQALSAVTLGGGNNKNTLKCNVCRRGNIKQLTEKGIEEYMDSGASDSMSGAENRMTNIKNLKNPIKVMGFNDSFDMSKHVGVNQDGKNIIYVPGMPETRDLLSAHAYTEEGAVLLLKDKGYVVTMNNNETLELEKYISKYDVTHVLKVKDRTYQVEYRCVQVEKDIQNEESCYALLSRHEVVDESIYNVYDKSKAKAFVSATNYLNGKVGYNNTDEMILGLYLSGFTPISLRAAISNNYISGIHPSVTIAKIRQFEKKHGKTPDLLQISMYDQQPHTSAYEGEHVELTYAGQRMSTDHMMSDYNESAIQTDATGKELSKRLVKLKTYGGGCFANVTVDEYTGFVIGSIGKSNTSSSEIIKELIDICATCDNPMKLLVADSGILVGSTHRVMTPEVQKLLTENHIKMELVMPEQHSIGGCHVEVVNRFVKKKMRTAINFAMQSPNISELGYTDEEILKFWGEIFLWAIVMINMGPAYNDKHLSRYQAYTKIKPNIQTLRILPIFSILMIKTGEVYEYGLYLGPQYLGPHVLSTPGCIRAAVKGKDNKITIYKSHNYKCVSQGYNLNVNKNINRSLIMMMRELSEDIDKDIVNQQEAELEALGAKDVEQAQVAEDPEEAQVAKDDEEAQVSEDNDENINENESDKAEESVTQVRGAGLSRPFRPYPGRSQRLRGESPEVEDIWWDSKRKAAARRDNTPLNHNAAEFVPAQVTSAAGMAAKSRGGKKVCTFKAMQTTLYEYEVDEDSKMYDNDYTTKSKDTYENEEIYYNYRTGDLLKISEAVEYDEKKDQKLYQISSNGYEEVKGFRAVKGPKSFAEALRDPKWSGPCNLEKSTITEGPMIKISKEAADRLIQQGADVLNIFPIYEEKIKDGKVVYKVRLVIDGSQHKRHGNTYAETPNREELRIFLHLIGHYDWEFYHVDEVRAFLSADHSGPDVVGRLDGSYYKVLGALYGLKTAPRDYQQSVIDRLVMKMGFQRLGMCGCIYTRTNEDTKHVVFVYDFVDDFVWTGTDSATTLAAIEEYKLYAKTTPTAVNPCKVLGLELVRDREKRTISLSLESKIVSMFEYIQGKNMIDRFELSESRVYSVPISIDLILVGDEHFSNGKVAAELCIFCCADDITEYLVLVGGHLWQIGVRWDILYHVLYLTWNTHAPRVYHLKIAVRLVLFLYHTRDRKLILGGKDKLEVITYTDMSLNTGPSGKSVIAYGTRLGPDAGLVCGKCKATVDVVLSSFEGELEGLHYGADNNDMVASNVHSIGALCEGFKQSSSVLNVLMELGEYPSSRRVYSDNKAMIDFVKGEAKGTGMKHATLRLWYMRQQISRGYDLIWMSGKAILANAMTKAVHKAEFAWYWKAVLGYDLLEEEQDAAEMIARANVVRMDKKSVRFVRIKKNKIEE